MMQNPLLFFADNLVMKVKKNEIITFLLFSNFLICIFWSQTDGQTGGGHSISLQFFVVNIIHCLKQEVSSSCSTASLVLYVL